MAVIPGGGLKVGECVDDWGLVKTFLLDRGFLNVVKGGGAKYDIGDGDPQEFRTQREMWLWLNEGDRLQKMEHALLLTVMDDALNSSPAKGGADDATGGDD